MASPEPSAARMMLREIARERSDLVGEKMKAMREEELDEIRNELFLILDGLETGRHVDEFLCLQKLVQGRVDLEPDTLIKMARPMQLEFLVAMRTGNKAFMSPITSDIPHNYIADVLLERRCANNKCLTRLPAYDCACHICATKKGFCSDCMCMICNKLQPQSGSCCWIRCDVCSHRAHMDCAIDGGQKTPGKKMLFRCKACLWTFELLGWVRKVFQECTPRWDSGDLLWELSYVYKIFHLSKDSEETKFSSICSELIGCLNSGSADESMCRRRLLEALQDRSHQKNNLEALEHICMDASADPVELPYALIECITNGFSKRIGNGGFGVVYMGVFRNKKVAVKKLYQTGHFSDKQFEDELKCLRRVKHENIVRFLGYCSDTQEKAVEYNGQFVLAEDRRRFLCFEYAPNKSLHDYLKDESQRHEWDTHYQMIKGICKGLCYLHNIERINHLDLKPENILLDADMVPKITDFGLSRRFSGEQSRIITKNIRGSRQYMAPEHWSKGEISFESDIFSFGIIIRKILCGSHYLSDFETWHQLLNTDSPQVKRCIKISQLCVDEDPCRRPTIDRIVGMLSEKETVIETNSTVSAVHKRKNFFGRQGCFGSWIGFRNISKS